VVSFAISFLFLNITPGIGVLSLAGIGANSGFKNGISFLFGLYLGKILICSIIISGFGVIFKTNDFLRYSFVIISFLYLSFLSYKIAFSNSKINFIKDKNPSILSGIFLQLLNPKAYVVSSAIFSGYPFMTDFKAEVVIKLIIISLIFFPVHFFWLWIGSKIHDFNLSEKSQKNIKYLLAISLFIVVILGVTSIL